MFDTIVFECRCGQRAESQTKVLGTCGFQTFMVGNIEPENIIKERFNSVFEEKLANCLFKVKDKCSKCGIQNIIRIIDSKLIEIIKDKNELMLIELNNEYVIEEKSFGNTI